MFFLNILKYKLKKIINVFSNSVNESKQKWMNTVEKLAIRRQQNQGNCNSSIRLTEGSKIQRLQQRS